MYLQLHMHYNQPDFTLTVIVNGVPAWSVGQNTVSDQDTCPTVSPVSTWMGD